MITMSFRISKRRVMACALALAIVATGGLFVRSRMNQQSVMATDDTTTVKLKGKNPTVKTPEQRLAFISQYGWEVNSEPVEVLEVLIPQEFDEVFTKYNYIQKQQGFDLLKLRGKRCKRYTYQITNYPGGIANVRINLLIYKDKIIGGDVSTVSLDGFMHGFDIATATTWLSIPEQSSPAQDTEAPVTGQTAETAEVPTETAGDEAQDTGLSTDLFPMAGSPEGEAAGAGMLD